MICKLPQQSDIKMADWFAKNKTHGLPFSPRRRFRISISDYYLEEKVSDISQFVLKRTVHSPSPWWNISRYLPTTTRRLTKNSKNFQPLLRQVTSYFIRLFDILTSFVRKYYVAYLKYHALFKPNSSPCFGLRSNKGSSPVKEPVNLTDDVKQRKQ